MNTEAAIKALYEDNNYPGFHRLLKIVKLNAPTIPKEQVKTFYDKQTAKQLMAKKTKPDASGHIVAFVAHENWQLDIFDMQRYQKSNDGVKYMLVAVDVFSRKAFVEPMHAKDGVTCARALEDMVNRTGVKPRSILSDNESAFMTESFQLVLDKHRIALSQNVVGDHHALGIIDSFARRIKTILNTYFLTEQTTNWVDVIQQVIDRYNRTIHIALDGLSPNEATKKENHQKIQEINFEKSKDNRKVSDLTAGNKVRKSIVPTDKSRFKGTDPRCSAKVFTVTAARGGNVELNDGSTMKRWQVLSVPDDAESFDTDVINVAKKANKRT